MRNFKKTIKQLLFLLALIVFTFWLIFRKQNFNEIYNIVINANAKFVILGIIAMFLYFTAEAYNLRRIMKAFGEEMSLIKAIKFTLIGFFFSSITPAATGGQPMEIYYMYKEKYTSTYAMTALLIQFCCFQCVTILAGIAGAIINSSYVQGNLIYLLLIGLTFNSIALIGTLIFLFSKRLTRFLLNIAIKLLEIIKYKKIDSAKEKLEKALEKYNDCSDFIKKHKSIFIKSFLVVCFQVFMYYSISFLVYKSFNLSRVGAFRIITVQALLYSTVSSLPLPGAVGVSESAFLKMFSNIFGLNLINSAMILNRGINFYLYVIISTIVVIINILFVKKEKVMNLRKEKSCGCIIVKDNKVLLVYEKNRNFWGFPKGHMENEENEIETALREVKEEVGLDVEIDEEKRYTLNYIIRDEIDKTTVLYIAKPKNDKIIMQEGEIENAKWCSFEEALNTLTFDNWKEMFKKVIEDIS